MNGVCYDRGSTDQSPQSQSEVMTSCPFPPMKENDFRRSEPTLSSGKLGGRVFVVHPPANPRCHTADPTVKMNPRAHARGSKTPPFSCRRWRRLTGKLPEETTQEERLRDAMPSSHGSSLSKGFVSVFPTSSDVPSHGRQDKPPPSRNRGMHWQAIDRFDGGVMQKLVDNAYGITANHHIGEQFPLHHGQTREAQRQFIHRQVYLPSVHRTLDYIHKSRELRTTPQMMATMKASSPTTTARMTKPLRPPPIGTRLLSSQLHTLQAELLAHYESERMVKSKVDEIWSPRPSSLFPQRPPSVADSLSRSHSSSGSFRNPRHSYTKLVPEDRGSIVVDDETKEEDRTVEDEQESVLILTDSDTYSLSSGVEADSEMEVPRHVPAGVGSSQSSGTESWSSLESHVLQALEGSEAVQLGSVHERLVVVNDSDDLGIFTDTSSEQSEPRPRDMINCLAEIRSSAIELDSANEDVEELDHIVFVDNGIRVNAAGQALSVEDEVPEDTWGIMCEESHETIHSGPSEESYGKDETERPSEATLLAASGILCVDKATERTADEAVNRVGVFPSLSYEPVPDDLDRSTEDPNPTLEITQYTSEEAEVTKHDNEREHMILPVEREAYAQDVSDAEDLVEQDTTVRQSSKTLETALLNKVSFVPVAGPESFSLEVVHRDSISSTATYGDAEFEDVDEDTGSDHGYETFED